MLLSDLCPATAFRSSLDAVVFNLSKAETLCDEPVSDELAQLGNLSLYNLCSNRSIADFGAAFDNSVERGKRPFLLDYLHPPPGRTLHWWCADPKEIIPLDICDHEDYKDS